MHVMHLILVKGKSKELALEKVQKLINSPKFAPWSDWSEIGGRWGNTFIDDIISQKDTPQVFDKAIKEAMESRNQVFQNYAETISGYDFTAVNLTTNKQYITEMFALQAMGNMYWGEFDPDSYVYDAEHRSTYLSSMEADIIKGATNWHAVVVDFHF